MNIRTHLFYALVSGLLLGIPWLIPSSFIFIFIAWVPLFLLEENLGHGRNRYAVFNYALAGFIVWNILGSWWISKAQLLGALCIILANALLQALMFWSASRVRVMLKIPFIIPFLFIWMGYEHFHNNWDLAWPWFNLGNALVTAPKFIQWYEFTGVRGGSLWIILANFAVLKAYGVFKRRGLGPMVPFGAGILLWLFIPSVLSLQIYRHFQPQEESVKIALIQPNLDPYTEKFIPEKQAQHLEAFFKAAETVCDRETRYLFGPETLIVHQIDEQNPMASPYYGQLMDFRDKHPQVTILLGIHSFQRVDKDIPPGSRFDEKGGFYYEAFNTALFLAPGASPQFYHKTKLVPLFERMPFVQYLGFLGRFSLELGGYSGTYSDRQDRTHFLSPDGSTGILPIVCFESIFGPYCAQNLPKTKGFICLITNDGWWKDTPGYRHHFNFSPIRAIECRRDLVRVANTGISAIIDAKGMVVAQTPWWERARLKGHIRLREGRTFFVRHGDYIGRISLLIGVLFIIVGLIRHILNRQRNPGQGPSVEENRS